MSSFDNKQVKIVSDFLQNYMATNSISEMSADECAEVLASNSILSNKVGPKLGFNFRQMLRDGRNGLIDLVVGACQTRPNTKWTIYCKLDKKTSP
jgi:hypothetical protein